jgi:hypothetical protein
MEIPELTSPPLALMAVARTIAARLVQIFFKLCLTFLNIVAAILSNDYPVIHISVGLRSDLRDII